MEAYDRRKDMEDFMEGKAIDWDETIYDFKQRMLGSIENSGKEKM